MKKFWSIFRLFLAFALLVLPAVFINVSNVLAAQNLAVTPPGWDDMGAILKKQGLTFKEIDETDLKLGEKLKGYDAIFINCSRTIYKEVVTPEDAGAIRDFVRGGGVVYASDYAGSVIEAAFPDKIDFYDIGGDDQTDGAHFYNEVLWAGIGNAGGYDATVTDSGLASVLGKKTIQINFDKSGWELVKDVGSGTQVYIRGPASYYDEDQENDIRVSDIPYVVSFSEGDGEVLFTAFHNETQITRDVEKMLDWFATRTRSSKLARATREIARKDKDDKVLQEIVDTIGSGQEKTYEFKASGKGFGLIVNFEGGAELSLEVIAPDGSTVASEKVTEPPYIKEKIDAKEGTYKFRVKGEKISENNMPIVLSVFGSEKAAVEPIFDEGQQEAQEDSASGGKKTAGVVISLLIILAVAFYLKKFAKSKASGKKTKK